jgi:hypothetical protein
VKFVVGKPVFKKCANCHFSPRKMPKIVIIKLTPDLGHCQVPGEGRGRRPPRQPLWRDLPH